MTTRITPFVEHEDVIEVVGVEDALRGWSCYERGQVFDARLFGGEQDRFRLWAQCAGNHPTPYRVSVSLQNAQVVGSRCSCPDTSNCTHVAALLYSWIHDSEIFERVEDWRTELGLWSKDRLVSVIFAIAQQSPEIEELLQAEIDGEQWFSTESMQDVIDDIRHAALWRVPELADDLVEEGYADQAVMLVCERLGGERSGILVDWLIEHHERVGDYSGALTWARRRLDDVPRASYYATVWSIAQRLGVWGELRPTLLARLRRANFAESIKALLLEGRFSEALTAYEEGLQQGKNVSDATRLRLAEVAESIDPERALVLYSALIGGLIERRTREHYRMAANLLARIELLYGVLGRQNEWKIMLDEFVTKYPRRPVLFEELERVNLRSMD